MSYPITLFIPHAQFMNGEFERNYSYLGDQFVITSKVCGTEYFLIEYSDHGALYGRYPTQNEKKCTK